MFCGVAVAVPLRVAQCMMRCCNPYSCNALHCLLKAPPHGGSWSSVAAEPRAFALVTATCNMCTCGWWYLSGVPSGCFCSFHAAPAMWHITHVIAPGAQGASQSGQRGNWQHGIFNGTQIDLSIIRCHKSNTTSCDFLLVACIITLITRR